MRCASPPERESAERPRVRYSRPTLLRKRRRSFTSLRIGRAISGSRPAAVRPFPRSGMLSRSEEHTSELQSRLHLVCRLLLEKKKKEIKAKETMLTNNIEILFTRRVGIRG